MSTSSGTASRRSRFHQRFIVEERYMPVEDRRRLYRSATVLIGVGLIALAALIAQVVTRSGLAGLDIGVYDWFTDQRSREGTVVMDFLATAFGPIYLPIIIAVVLIVWIVAAKHLWRPLLLAAAMLVGAASVQLIAHLVGRSRPPVGTMLLGPDLTNSFPSGHVVGVCDFFLVTTFLLASRRTSRAWAVGGFVLSLAMIAGQVVNRLYLGYHWMTDTLGSLAVALVMLGSVVAIDTWRTVRVPGEEVSGPLSAVETRRS